MMSLPRTETQCTCQQAQTLEGLTDLRKEASERALDWVRQKSVTVLPGAATGQAIGACIASQEVSKLTGRMGAFFRGQCDRDLGACWPAQPVMALFLRC